MSNNLKQPVNSPGLRKAVIKKGFEGIKGVVVESLPNTDFKVKLEDGRQVITKLSGRMRKAYIRVSLGDVVVLEVDPNLKFEDGDRAGRIVFREK